MHRYHPQRWAARFTLALFTFVLPFGFAQAQQQTPPAPQETPAHQGAAQQAAPAQQGAAQQPDAAKGQPAEAQRQITQPGNNAPLWRDVRSGDINAYQTTQVRGVETNVLVQTEGETWRRIRNGPITVYGGWLIVAVFLLLGLFYWRKGEMMLHEPKTGRVIVRFTP